jgi:hypothetical protein
MADLYRATPSSLGFTVQETPVGVALSAPAFDAFRFNRLIVLDGDAPGVESHVARFRGLGVHRFGVQVAPAFGSSALKGALLAEGLAPHDSWAKLSRPAGPVPAALTDLRIESVAAEHAGIFGEVACTGFGMPRGAAASIASIVARAGWYAVLAWDGDEAVACAALCVRDDVGWLGIAATLPAARKRGAQSALLARRLELGMAAGCRTFVVETAVDLPVKPNPSFHNVVRAGFTVAYERPNWLPR